MAMQFVIDPSNWGSRAAAAGYSRISGPYCMQGIAGYRRVSNRGYHVPQSTCIEQSSGTIEPSFFGR